MKITALEEYGLRCMVQLARAGMDSPLTLAEISEREGLTVPYAGKLLSILRRSGLVRAERGRNGGFTLSRPPGRIRLSDVFQALGEPMFGSSYCERYRKAGEEECIHLEDCVVRDVWSTFHALLSDVLRGVTLEDLASKRGAGKLDLLAIAERRRREEAGTGGLSNFEW